MPPERALRSVAHNLAEHAISGLGYLTEHLSRAAYVNRRYDIVLDLRGEHLLPLDLTTDDPLRRASASLKEWFDALLAKEGFTSDAVHDASLTFHFSAEWPKTHTVRTAKERMGYSETPENLAFHGESKLVTPNGRIFLYEFQSWHYYATDL
jgi:hypothetical protein